MDENNNTDVESENCDSKKDNSCNCSIVSETKHVSSKPTLSVTVTPGNKGGNFTLPLQAKLSVEEGTFGKKDHVTCTAVHPSDRWRQSVQLAPDEHVTSEFFVISTTATTMKKAVIIKLPFYPVDEEFCELNVKGKWNDEDDWINIGFLKTQETTPPYVELELSKLGEFVVTFTPRKETFDVTTQGCLYNARRNRQISIRFPKKGIDQNIQCSLQIEPVSVNRLDDIARQFALECHNLLRLSEFIDFLPNVQPNFRRAATVKLPLPAGVELDGDDSNDVVVLSRTEEGGWRVVESHYKFSRNSVSFDVKHLSRFCVCQMKPDRLRAMPHAVSVVEKEISREKGEVVVFLSVEEKTWTLTVEAFLQQTAESRISKRTSSGYVVVKRYANVDDDEDDEKPFSKRGVRGRKQTRSSDCLELQDGQRWEIHIENDVKASFHSDYHDNRVLQFLKQVPESYRQFAIEPSNNEEKALIGVVELTPVQEDDVVVSGDSLVFNLEISEDAVKEYFKPKDEEKPPEVKPTEEVTQPAPSARRTRLSLSANVQIRPQVALRTDVLPGKTQKQISLEVTERLTRCPRRTKTVEKESRVLTGRSLMSLSKVVPEGLTLAVHLDLPDSTITGLGFDAISNGMGMADVTYKILMYWKRRLKNRRDVAVDVLCRALRNMGKSDIANLVDEKHRNNSEISLDSFDSIITI